MRLLLFLFLILIVVTTPCFAFSVETEEYSFTVGGDNNNQSVTDQIIGYIDDFVDTPDGAVDWKVLGKTKEMPTYVKMEDGLDNNYVKPEFHSDILALDGAVITIKGYMFPLNETDEQKMFLFGPFPLTCPFRYHVGPPLVMEVHADEHPVTFNYDPVMLTGTLELVHDDPEYSIFYRLKDAKEVK